MEIAITGYEVALMVYTEQAFPQNWAGTQNNLGLAYANKIRGEQTENLERAIACYQRIILLCDRAFWTTRKIYLKTPINFNPFSDTVTSPSELCFIFVKKISIISVVTTGIFNEKWLHLVLTCLKTRLNFSVNT
ncbi:hypothetical protein [uncultured Nostoc sp.]|uniref:hypothetical protein n=1 Tax=uncultured Nostoc sp. TaxID=340711 RepID=UPI0035CA7DC6